MTSHIDHYVRVIKYQKDLSGVDGAFIHKITRTKTAYMLVCMIGMFCNINPVTKVDGMLESAFAMLFKERELMSKRKFCEFLRTTRGGLEQVTKEGLMYVVDYIKDHRKLIEASIKGHADNEWLIPPAVPLTFAKMIIKCAAREQAYNEGYEPIVVSDSAVLATELVEFLRLITIHAPAKQSQ